MNKKELIEALKDYPDNAEIRIWRWTKTGSKYYLTNPTLSNNVSIYPGNFDLGIGRAVSETMVEPGAEVKFKIRDNSRDWEEIPVLISMYFLTAKEANEFAKKIARAHNAEVRWNWSWSNQGHYVDIRNAELE
ncbi:MAG: hypothetical protein AAGU15_08855 [Anaerolineaceae bacterium]